MPNRETVIEMLNKILKCQYQKKYARYNSIGKRRYRIVIRIECSK